MGVRLVYNFVKKVLSWNNLEKNKSWYFYWRSNGVGMEVIFKTFIDKRMLEFCTPVVLVQQRSPYHKK